MQNQNKKSINPALDKASKSIVDSLQPQVRAFYNFHGVQLLGSQFPVTLINTLYNKLKNQVYDGGNFFQILDNEADSTFEVRTKSAMPQESNVFLIDHAISFRYPDLKKTLKQNPNVVPRLLQMLKYYDGPKQLPWKNDLEIEDKQTEKLTSNEQFEPSQVQFDSMNLTEVNHLQFPPNTVTLSLCSNQIADAKQLIKKLDYLNLKILWLNENPVMQNQEIINWVNEKTKIQMFNSKLTRHCTEWGLKYCQNRSLKEAYMKINQQVHTLNLDNRDAYNARVQLFQKLSGIRKISLRGHQIKTQEHKNFFIKLFSLPSLKYVQVDYETETQIFKLYENGQIKRKIMVNKHQLGTMPPTEFENQVQEIHSRIFKLAGCYRLASTQKLDQTSIWYVNDELGSAITHSDAPNVKAMPFLYASDNKIGENMQAFTVLWPVNDIQQNGLVQRNFLFNITEEKQRSSRLSIWYKLPKKFYEKVFLNFNRNMLEGNKGSVKVLQQFYKINAVKQKEYIEKLSESNSLYPSSFKLITNDSLVIQYLKEKRIEFVKDLSEAQIIWMSDSLSTQEEWKEYKEKFFINQFPYESCVVNKKYLADTVQSVFGDTNFLMRTYDLESQLAVFLGDFYSREQQGQDNMWIIKPPNMARSMDMLITDNLSLIVKSMETGPKIAQKYITHPVLRQGRKVDLRYVLVVKSVLPLTMFLYKHFWIRSANNPYTVDSRSLQTYETQFTVMNYGQKSDFKQIKYADFITDFEKDYTQVKWSTITQKIKKMLRLVFIAAAKKYPEMQNDKSRAVYGIDIMIDEQNMQPKLLEITFAPDCNRACKYYPEFYNQIFQTLFLDEPSETMDRII